MRFPIVSEKVGVGAHQEIVCPLPICRSGRIHLHGIAEALERPLLAVGACLDLVAIERLGIARVLGAARQLVELDSRNSGNKSEPVLGRVLELVA